MSPWNRHFSKSGGVLRVCLTRSGPIFDQQIGHKAEYDYANKYAERCKSIEQTREHVGRVRDRHLRLRTQFLSRKAWFLKAYALVIYTDKQFIDRSAHDQRFADEFLAPPSDRHSIDKNKCKHA